MDRTPMSGSTSKRKRCRRVILSSESEEDDETKDVVEMKVQNNVKYKDEEDTRLRKKFKLDRWPELRVKLHRLDLASLTLSSSNGTTMASSTASTPSYVIPAEIKTRKRSLHYRPSMSSSEPNMEYEDDRSSVYSKAEDYNDWCSSKRIETVMPKSASKTETRQPRKGKDLHNLSSKTNKQPDQFCKKCDRAFNCPKEIFEAHLTVHKFLMPYECPKRTCDASFQHKDELVDHIEEHKNSRPVPCTECDQRFCNKSARNIHILKKHSNNIPPYFTCPTCEAGFYRKSDFTCHLKRHSTIKPYTCEVCSKKFKSRYGHKLHMNDHNNIRPFKCSKCTERFLSSAGVEDHYKRVHKAQKYFKCSNCVRQFRYESSFLKHQKRNSCVGSHLKPYACEECGHRYLTEGACITHVRTIHGLRHKRKLKCPECDACFTSRYMLRVHRFEIHNVKFKKRKNPNFKCKLCDSSFSSDGLRNLHMKEYH